MDKTTTVPHQQKADRFTGFTKTTNTEVGWHAIWERHGHLPISSFFTCSDRSIVGDDLKEVLALSSVTACFINSRLNKNMLLGTAELSYPGFVQAAVAVASAGMADSKDIANSHSLPWHVVAKGCFPHARHTDSLRLMLPESREATVDASEAFYFSNTLLKYKMIQNVSKCGFGFNPQALEHALMAEL